MDRTMLFRSCLLSKNGDAIDAKKVDERGWGSILQIVFLVPVTQNRSCIYCADRPLMYRSNSRSALQMALFLICSLQSNCQRALC